VAHMEEMKNAYKILAGNPEGKRLLQRSRRRWKIIGKYGGMVWTGCIWLRVGTSGGLL